MKFYRALVITVLVAFALWGCTDRLAGPRVAEYSNPYEWVGQAHNNGLSSALGALEQATKEIRNGADPVTIAEVGLAYKLSAGNGVELNQAALDAGRRSAIESRPIQCTEEERPFVERMAAVERMRPPIEVFDDSLITIERDAYIVLGEKSRTILLASSLARSSLRYWKQNALRWWHTLARTQSPAEFSIAHADSDDYGGDGGGTSKSDSVLNDYAWRVQQKDWEAAFTASIMCVWSSLAWGPCVLMSSTAASSAYAIFNYPYWGKVWG